MASLFIALSFIYFFSLFINDISEESNFILKTMFFFVQQNYIYLLFVGVFYAGKKNQQTK